MKTWNVVIIVALLMAFMSLAQSKAGEHARANPMVDRTPLITLPDPDQQRETPEPVEDVQEERTMEERVEELEYLVRRLERMVDPDNRRDEMRLERRLRDLERQMENVEQELRRLENRLRTVELRR